MAETQIRFTDGAAYERFMGVWSRMAGDIFIDWLAPQPALRWIDVGCGNGAFTELLIERCGPQDVQGIDPSDGQLAFARTRPGARAARFQEGDAMALPFADDSFDAAAMALVIFFVPEPAKGVAEMARVVCPGGTVAAYAWDMEGGGFPAQPMNEELRALGRTPLLPPHPEAARIEVLHDLWRGAGLTAIETRKITVTRTFADFADFWAVSVSSPSGSTMLATLAPDEIERLQERLRIRLPADAAGRITYGAYANAVKGRVPE